MWAGAAALLLEARPNTPAQAVGRLLQNSALPKVWSGNPALGLIEAVHRQGAGMLQIDMTILTTTEIEPSDLALGESQSGPALRTLTIKNKGVTYDLSHHAAVTTGANTFTPSFFSAPATVVFSTSSLTVPAGGSALVNVAITPNAALADRGIYGGYLVVTPHGGDDALRVPYAGFNGDCQSIPVLVPTAAAHPWLAKLVGATFTNQPGGATFTLAGVRRLRMEVFDAASGKACHRALDEAYVGRNSAATSFFALPWDGNTVNGKQTNLAPNGTYVIKLSVPRALGDANNPAH